MFKISIITINYNNLEGLKKTVESVILQSSNNFEYIVIDGGSTDGSKEFIEAHYQHFDYWVSESDNGIYNAMNKGIKAASGDFILFLNSGDVLLEDTTVLEKVTLHLKEKVVYYTSIYIDQISGIRKKMEYPVTVNERFVFTNTICQQAVLYHTSVFRGNYFDEKLKYISDWKMHFNLFRRKCKFIYLNIPFAIYDSNGLTSKGATKYTSHKERLKVQFQEFPFYFFKYYGTNYRMYLRLLKMYLKVS